MDPDNDIQAQEEPTVEQGDVMVDDLADDIQIDHTQQSDDDPSLDDQADSYTASTNNDDTSTSDDDSTDDSTDDGGQTASPDTTDDTDAGGAATADTDDQSVDDSGGSDVDPFSYLTEETGVEIQDEQGLVNALTELNDYRSGKIENQNDPLANLSPAIRQAIEVEQQGGDLVEHFRRTSLDFEKMDAQEVLWQKFTKDNSALHKQNPKLARMKFDRAFATDYGLFQKYNTLSEEEKQEFLEENNMQDIEYEKLMFENDVTQARSEMQAWKEENKPVANNTNGNNTLPEVTDEMIQAYQKQADISLQNFEATTIPIGEGLEDYALGLNEKTKPLIEEWVHQPSSFLQAIGFGGDSIDTDTLLPIMTLVAEAAEGTLGTRLKEYIVSQDNIQTITKKVEDGSNFSKDTPRSDDKGDLWDQVGDAIVVQREGSYRR